ncbi:MAG: hypothetical protein IKA75_07245 [Bacteroidaceae bacterium]|nr:hypothetical protein [Bacteroidaceae bacterium]
MKLSEPAIAYDSVPLQQLKSRLVETIGMENRVIKLQQCLDLLQNDDEEIAQREEEFLKNIPVGTRRLAVDAALSDYRTGKCVSQNEMKGWMKERLGWK